MVFNFFMKRVAAAASDAQIPLTCKRPTHGKKGTLTLHKELPNYLFEIYATHDVIAEIDPEKYAPLAAALNQTLHEYAEILWWKEFHFDRVYHECAL